MLIAPFLPFMTEEIYGNLVKVYSLMRERASVRLSQGRSKWIDEIGKHMDAVLKLVTLGCLPQHRQYKDTPALGPSMLS